jgi:hypothetical protein
MDDRRQTQAFSTLRDHIHRWIRVRARRRKLDHHLEDLLATADLALIESAQQHDPLRGELAPFAVMAVKHATLRHLHRERIASRINEIYAVHEPSLRYPPHEPLGQPLRDRLTRPTDEEVVALSHLLHDVPLTRFIETHGLTRYQARRAVVGLRRRVAADLEQPALAPDPLETRNPIRPTREPIGDNRPQTPHLDEVSSPHGSPGAGPSSGSAPGSSRQRPDRRRTHRRSLV